VPQIVVGIPEELKILEGPLKELVRMASTQLASQKAGGRVGYEAFERALEQRSGALERAVHKATLGARSTSTRH